MLIEGKWTQNWQPRQKLDDQGRFIRQVSYFRNWITADGSAGPTGQGGFKAEPERYHLYVAYICPWAARTLMARTLKKLEQLVSVTVLNPRMSEQGWQFDSFPGAQPDKLYGRTYLHEIYTMADPVYSGRATVPVLWDKQQKCIVNNESADILRMFNTAFFNLAEPSTDLYPTDLHSQIDDLNQQLYQNLNNAVYQAGFATTQLAYEEAYSKVFATLDELETRLADGRDYLFGNRFTESDIRLFVTLIRFDAAYHGLFKCNRNLIRDMPYLQRYTQRIYNLGGIADTVRIDHIKTGYYSIRALNPTGLVPLGPDLPWQ